MWEGDVERLLFDRSLTDVVLPVRGIEEGEKRGVEEFKDVVELEVEGYSKAVEREKSGSCDSRGGEGEGGGDGR